MKREITFGKHSALLHNGAKCAKLYIDEPALPVALADAINKEPKIDVTDVSKHKDYSCIRMFHELTAGELIDIICSAIGAVYNSDTSIIDARPKSSI